MFKKITWLWLSLPILFGIGMVPTLLPTSNTIETTQHTIKLKQAGPETLLVALQSYPLVENVDFIESLIVNQQIDREKLGLYVNLINVPDSATFELLDAKSFDDGKFDFTLGVSPWIDNTGTERTDIKHEAKLSLMLLPENYQPPKPFYTWLWIVIGVVSAIIIVIITTLIIQRRKDLKGFPYRLDLG